MANLALLGGNKIVTADNCSKASKITDEAIALINKMCHNNETSFSPVVDEFEEKWKEYLGAKYGVTTPNGTAAIQEGLFAVGVGYGDEVIVPSFNFIFSAAPIVTLGAIPVFCDIDINTHTVDIADIENRITPKTKAILLVHVWGNPANMDGIMKLAKKYNLKVVEDCAHAHGSMWKDKKVGIIGDVGCYSFQSSKSLSAGEGGMLVTNDKECYERAVAFGHYERVKNLPEESPYKKYWTSMGYKHRIHPLGVALLSEQFKSLDYFNKVRSTNGKYFDKAISEIDCFIPVQSHEGATRQYSYHYGRYNEKALDGIALKTILYALKAEGVAVGSNGYGFLHEAPLFVESNKNIPELPNTIYLRERNFLMASRFESENKEIIDQHIEAYRKVAKNVDELHRYEKENKDIVMSASYQSANFI